jgi:hypothetical protein
MSRAFLFAFVAVAGVAATAVDYVNQSRRAGLGLGQLSPGDYIATISGRHADTKAPAAADAQRPRAQMKGTLAEIRLMEASARLMLGSGRITPEAYAGEMADLAARREAVIAQAKAAEAAGREASEDHAPAGETDGQTGAVIAAGESGDSAGALGLAGRIMGLLGGTEAATVALGGPSDAIVSIAPQSEGQERGIADFILGVFSGDAAAAGGSNEAGVVTETPAPQISSLMGKKGKLGGNCTKQGAFKRCTIGN